MGKGNGFICRWMTPGLLLFIAGTISWPAVATDNEITSRLDYIRSIEVVDDEDKLSMINRRLDEIWAYFQNNKEVVLPLLARELDNEAGTTKPADLLLLDIGYFLYRESDDPQHRHIAREALYRLDPGSEIIRANLSQLFSFAHAVAADRDPRILAFVDRAFLRAEDGSVFIPQHMLSLDPTLMGVFLYGVYGEGAEEHLISLLAEDAVMLRVLEILIWIGTDKSRPAVARLMQSRRSGEIYARGLAWMMRVGGPEGRRFMLELDISGWPAEVQDGYGKIREQIVAQDYDWFRSSLQALSPAEHLSGDVVKSRMEKMYENYGRDTETAPVDILAARLDRAYLIEQLVKIRRRMLYRVSDEGLSDVQITNLLLNGLRYRPD